jgi:hypothetical protein
MKTATSEKDATKAAEAAMLAKREEVRALAIPRINSPAIVKTTALNSAALARVTQAQVSFAAKLAEIEEWLSMPFVSPKAIASNTWLFTLLKHGETTFERENEDGSIGIDEVHLWLAVAQEPIEYVKGSGEMVKIETNDKFIVSQKVSKVRDRIAIEIIKILDGTGETIPNVTCRFAKMSSKAKLRGWSAPVTFAVAEFAE